MVSYGTTEDLDNIPASVYSVLITDFNNCSYQLSHEIFQPSTAIFVESQITDVKCFGENTGEVELNIQGGTSPFQISWSNGQNTTQINNLIIELYEVLPYNKDIALNKTAIELLISTNPRILYNAFVTYVMPYKNQIMERDDAFFLNETIRSTDAVNRQVVKTLTILRNSWSRLTESTQNNVWLYFAVLINLCERVMATERNAV